MTLPFRLGSAVAWIAGLAAVTATANAQVISSRAQMAEFARDKANPGRGWVSVKAAALEPAALMEALEAGRFYASTGVTLADVRVSPERMEVHIEPAGDFRYTTVFIGAGGRELARSGDNPAVYELRDAVGYVRARVTDSGGLHAWTQPVFVVPR